MGRWVVRVTAAIVVAIIPAALGTLMAVLYSPPGTRLLGRLAGAELTRVFRGSFSIERVGGSFIHGIVLDQLEIRDTAGALFARVPRLRVTYQLPQLFAGQLVFRRSELDGATIHVVKRSNGRLNLHEIFRLGEGPGGGGPPQLIEFHNLRLRRSTVEIWLPWTAPDTATTPAAVAAALAADRLKPARVILETPDGLRRVVTLEALNANIRRLLVSDPQDDPLTFDVDSLATRVSDPAVNVVNLAAHGWTRGDTLALTVRRLLLPRSRLTGGGVVTWPEGPLWYDLTLDAPRLDLRDLRWISPNFPSMTGEAVITAHTRNRGATAYTLGELDLRRGEERISGVVTAVADERRGIGVEGMALDLNQLNLDVPRPYLDTLPLAGTITGRLEGGGYLDSLDAKVDWRYDDSRVPGGATSFIVGEGHFAFGGGNPEGPLFDTVVVRRADLDLRTVRLQSPSVGLNGRLEMEGTLRGRWRNLTYSGTAVHRDGDRPASRATGTARLDTRDSAHTAFEADLRLDPLAFDGIRPSYPSIPTRGLVTGPVRLSGTVDRLTVSGEARGDLGFIAVDGVLLPRAGPGGIGADRFSVRFSGLDLATLTGRASPHTRLTGSLQASGTYDTVAGPTGRLTMHWGPSSLPGFPVDTLEASLIARGDSIIVLDSATMGWPGGKVAGSGVFGWRKIAAGEVRFGFDVDSLGGLDSSFVRLVPDSLRRLDSTLVRFMPDKADTARKVRGHATGEIVLGGSTAQPRAILRGRGREIRWAGVYVPRMAAGLAWNGTARPELNAVVSLDSLVTGTLRLGRIDGVIGGYADSLNWYLTAFAGDSAPTAAGGRWWSHDSIPVLAVDSLRIGFPSRIWRLRQPVEVALAPNQLRSTPMIVDPGDGSGGIRLEGSIPRQGAGSLHLFAYGIPVHDVYQLLARDTSGVGGTVQLDLTLTGTGAAPIFEGSTSVSDLSFGDFGAPFIQGVFHYANRQLEASLQLWQTGQPVLKVESRLPLDLALTGVSRRQVDGPLLVRASADSTDLGVVEAFTRNLRRVRGTLRSVLEVTGTWGAPRLGGEIEIRNASASVPGLGVRYAGVHLLAHMVGDSVIIDTLTARSGDGSLTASGGLRIERLSRPILDLTFHPRRFRMIDQRNFLTLDASGTFRLVGPIWQARLSGRVTADQGDLHFADLVTKRIVDIENPGDSNLIDVAALRQQRLGANFQSRFLDSLAIDNLSLTMGESFWLRSSEANIQLDGDMTVNKTRDRYRYDGTLNAVRGSYALKVGPVTREFTVDHGTVKYFGTPDLNADLDIQAEHVVISTDQTNRGEEVPVTASITGTLLQPKLTLSSTVRPPLSETELVSYLVYGRPSFSLQGGGTQGDNPALSAAVSYLSSALSSEIQRTLISDLGVPIDYIEIRPGQVAAGTVSGTGTSAQLAQVYAGWQIGRQWFVTLVADLCTNAQRFYPSAEYRVSREFRLKGSVEPSYSCNAIAGQPSFAAQKYQVGLDLLWEREY
jgi:translocation and assembly module TamB